MNYWQGKEENSKFEIRNSNERRGKFARYAWGDDYHEIIETRLRELDQWLADRGGTQKCYVDTGPVLERDFAALAGAGWHGKSTMLISQDLGTWFFLAEILTTLGPGPGSSRPATAAAVAPGASPPAPPAPSTPLTTSMPAGASPTSPSS